MHSIHNSGVGEDLEVVYQILRVYWNVEDGVDRKVSGAKKVVRFQGIFLNPWLINQCIFYAINSALKTRDCAPRIKLKTRVELMCSGRVGGYSTISDIPRFLYRLIGGFIYRFFTV